MKRDLEEIIKPALQNPVEHKMTAHDWKKHDASHICDICVRLLQEYYDNETQKFNGAAHNGCVEEACSAKRLDFRKSIPLLMEIDPTQRILRQYTSGLNYCNHACKKRKHEIKGKNDDGKCKSEDYKEIDYCEHGKYTLSTKNSTTMHKKMTMSVQPRSSQLHKITFYSHLTQQKKMTNVKLELSRGYAQRWMRGGNSMAPRHSEGRNERI
ncbi:hypothetical protein RIR_jg33518.t1 [Rhizophagus irregularis DAOM 181602=DAOM 197198]|nr:hypothetical protein RIR_jg33518.t1 [Rhizophagus irregularis DAOM 181602=DAOM 197198]